MSYQEKNKTKFDLVVIGTGAAATTIAYECNSAGLSVGIIDSRPFGGTCALRGCDPKKVLVGAAELVDWINRINSSEFLLTSENNLHKGKKSTISWHELMKFKKTFTDPVPKNKEKGFDDAGIISFHGNAEFAGPNSLKITEYSNTTIQNYNDNNQVNNNNNTSQNTDSKLIESKFIVIASGSKPSHLPIEGENYLTYSDQFLEMENLPENIVFVGGGYISFEFAHIAARAGAKVTILHRGERPLENFDPDLVNILIQKSKDIGIDLRLKSSVNKIEKSGHNYTVHYSEKDNISNEIKTDLVVHGAGRVPNVDNLNLEIGNVEYSRKGIKVNEYLQSVSNPAVYSAGDSADTKGLPLTPVASYEGAIVSTNILKGNQMTPDYDGIPSVVFTVPPLATVGMTEHELKSKNIKFKVNYQDTSNWYASKRICESSSAFKVLIDDSDPHTKNGKILGAHLIGHNSEEIINIFALAIRLNISISELKKLIYSYPTNSHYINYMM